ncbi:MAG: DUF6148 family protein [Flavobacteriales bacterium]|jgi:hypothetical protein
MAVTLTHAKTALDAWLAADLAVAKGQSYSMNGRSLTLANSREIREQIQYWERRVAALESANQNQQAALADFSDV